jgi:hypothetical protein
MPRRTTRSRTQDDLALLSRLVGRERLDHAVRVVEQSAVADVVVEAVRALDEESDPRLRRCVVARALALADSPADDPGCLLRVVLLRALRGASERADVPLLERAATTFEFLRPGPREVAGDLRRIALLCLHDVDPDRAAWHAVRLLTDEHQALSGEPALTAALVLGEQGQALPLYEVVLRHPEVSREVLAACLGALTSLPAPLVTDLFEVYGREGMDVQATLGLFDLVLAHPEREAFRERILEFLRSTTDLDVYRFVVTSIVARRGDPLAGVLDDLADEPQRDPRKTQVLREAMALLRPPDRA